MQTLVDETFAALDRLEARLPPNFPERVYANIRGGVLSQSRRFTDTAAASEDDHGLDGRSFTRSMVQARFVLSDARVPQRSRVTLRKIPD
jgi:hypothetical protein